MEKTTDNQTPPKKGNKKKKPNALEEVKTQAKEWENKYLYLRAEFDNFRKRMQREREDTLKYGNEDFIRSLLLVLDNFQRAADHALSLKPEKGSPAEQILQGVQMTQEQLLETLKDQGLEEIKSLGGIFDPNFHEAVTQKEGDGEKENTIIKEHQKGYLLNKRLLRAAKVTVIKLNKESEGK